MNKYVIGAVIVLVIAGGWIFYSGTTKTPPQTDSKTEQDVQPQQTNVQFSTPKKSAHYESNTPTHGAILAGVPVNVVLDFNFDLAPPASISIEMNGQDYSLGETTIDKNKLSMRRKMDPAAPDGLYTVKYNACWPDKTCHDGNFQFAIDRKQTASFINLTGEKEVTINLKDVAFSPKNVKLSKGTKITWINNDDVEHYVNTDSHPAHSYVLDLNSKALKKGESFSYTFDTAGIYPYHCSAHADSMTGSILVE